MFTDQEANDLTWYDREREIFSAGISEYFTNYLKWAQLPADPTEVYSDAVDHGMELVDVAALYK
jgi:hypothetical protein